MGLAFPPAGGNILAAWPDLPDKRASTRTHRGRRDHKLHRTGICHYDRMACFRGSSGSSIAFWNGAGGGGRSYERHVRSAAKPPRGVRGHGSIRNEMRAAIVTVSDTRDLDTDLS